MDFVTGLPKSQGNSVILSIVDRFSKAANFIALPKLLLAFQTAQLLTQHVIHIHGIPNDIVSDRGPQFISQVWKAFCKALGATPSLSSGFHPQTNGQAERANQFLEAALRCVAETNPISWSQHLPWVEYTHNYLPSSATRLPPFEATLGYQPHLLPSQEMDLVVCTRPHPPLPESLARYPLCPRMHPGVQSADSQQTEILSLPINLVSQCGFLLGTYLSSLNPITLPPSLLDPSL